MLALLAVFHRNIPHAARYFAMHFVIAVGIVLLAWLAARSRSRCIAIRAALVPVAAYIFFFEELQGLVHAIFPGWFDRWLIQFDYNFAGVHPAAWLARFATPALNDFMQFSYMTYFLYLVILPAILYAQKQRAAFWTVMTSTAIAHYSVYVIAILFPIESPYFALASLNLAPLTAGQDHGRHRFHRAFRPRPRRGVSLGARGRFDGRDARSAPLQAVAVLAVPAIFREHVRGDGVRALPLHGGCAGRDCGGRDRLGGRTVDDGTQGRGATNSVVAT